MVPSLRSGISVIALRCGPLFHVGESCQLDRPGSGCPDDSNRPAEELAAQLRRTFCEAAIDEADRSRVVTRFESLLEAGGQDRGESGVETICPFLAKSLGGFAQR